MMPSKTPQPPAVLARAAQPFEARQWSILCPFGPPHHSLKGHDWKAFASCVLNRYGWEVWDREADCVLYRNSLKAPVQRMVNRLNRIAEARR